MDREVGMDHRNDKGIDFDVGVVDNSRMWRLGTGVLGASLWAQLFWFPLATEFLSSGAGPLYVLVYLLPTLVLFVSLFVGSSAGFLFFFPGSFIPGLVMLPQQDVAALLQLHRAVFAAGTLVFFIFASALASRDAEEEGEPRSVDAANKIEGEEPERVEGLYRHYFGIRLVIMVILFGVLVGAPLFDESILGAIARHHADGQVAAQVFLVVFGFFTWCVIAYTSFFLPSANVEYNIRRLSRKIDGLADAKKVVRRRVGFLMAGGIAVVAALVFWQVTVG